MTVAQALAQAAALGLARLDAQLLLLHAIGRSSAERAWLLAHDSDPLQADACEAFGQACRRRLAGEPVAYLVGYKEFFGLHLQVDGRVLVPRPDTETLVDWSLAVLDGRVAPSVIDLGTGSGAIALAIRKTRADVRMVAVDRSEAALAVASANAKRLGLAVEFAPGDWLAGQGGPFDLVVSNPPYVAQGDEHLPSLVHEPRDALVAGADGLEAVRRIVGQAPACLVPGGWLLLEHGWDQAAAVRGLLAQAGFRQVVSRRDLAGIERCSGGQWPERG